MKTRRIEWAVLALLASCAAVGKDYERPDARTPSEWSAAPAASPVALERWWGAFDDTQLDALVARALEHNLDMAKAVERVREARAALGIAESARLPNVDAGVGYSRTRQSLDSRGGAPFFGKRENDLWDVGFDAKWELDVFGGARRGIEAATADLQALDESKRAVEVSIVAEVARAYVELRGYQQRLEIARARIEMQRQLAEIVRVRADAGVSSDLDASRADAQVALGRADVPTLEARIAERIHALSVLVGDVPRALEFELARARAIPAPNAALALEQPIELLRRRPDVRSAERRCAAASARVAVAVAARYPRVSLGASFGWLANDTGDLFKSSSLAASILPSISLPLFDGGLRRSQLDAASAREAQAVLDYQDTVLAATKEVEDALSALASANARRTTLREAVASQARAESIARDLYSGGVADFLTVLDAERELFSAQDALAQSDADAAVQFVALAKALGGGWQPDQSEPIAAVTR